MVIPYQWLVAGDFSEGMAPVSVSMMKMGYINTKGEMIVPDRWTFACSHKDGVAFVADAMTMESGYIDRTGRFFNPSHPLEFLERLQPLRRRLRPGSLQRVVRWKRWHASAVAVSDGSVHATPSMIR